VTVHKPVLLNEVLEALNPQKNENFIDCTVGGGGHAEAILERTGPNGKLLGFDWDPEAIKRSKERLVKYKNRIILVNESYLQIKKIIYDARFTQFNGILLDLGLSSDQLQDSGRGFSFQVNEPLDMRFSPFENELTAEKIINTYSEERLVKIFWENGEEPFSKRLAKAIVLERKNQPIKTTLELVSLVVRTLPKKKTKIHPATKIFQALRMEVNNELANVRKVLSDALEVMESGSKLAVITFHSLEDRIVKQFFRHEARQCICPPEIPECRCNHQAKIKIKNKKPITPSTEEITANFRSRSAKLRVIEKI